MINKEKYLKAPWHNTKNELPDTGRGNVCVCYVPSYGCEMRMVFHRARKDSGYKDFFTADGRSYDYDFIAYWRYYADKEDEYGVLEFMDEAIADLETVLIHSRKLRENLGNWRTLEAIPLEHWRSFPKENPSDEVLRTRKELDRKKFREPAKQALRDLNRGLVSLGLGTLEFEKFVKM